MGLLNATTPKLIYQNYTHPFNAEVLGAFSYSEGFQGKTKRLLVYNHKTYYYIQ